MESILTLGLPTMFGISVDKLTVLEDTSYHVMISLFPFSLLFDLGQGDTSIGLKIGPLEFGFQIKIFLRQY